MLRQYVCFKYLKYGFIFILELEVLQNHKILCFPRHLAAWVCVADIWAGLTLMFGQKTQYTWMGLAETVLRR